MFSPVWKMRKLPVPYVFLLSPASKAAWPNVAACWSPRIPRDRGLPQKRRALGDAVDLRGGADLRHHRARHAEVGQDVVAPLQRLEVHEERARRVRDIRRVHTSLDTAREVPEDPRVGRAEQQVAGLGLLARSLDVLEDPDDLRAREVGRERETDDALVPLDAEPFREPVDDRLRTGVLPHDRVVDGLAGALVPHHGGLTLVRDADRRDVVACQVGLAQGDSDDLLHIAPDLQRVVLDPAGLREDLLVLELTGGDDRARLVEDDGAAGRRALVDRDDVLGHVRTSLSVEVTVQMWWRRTVEARAAIVPPMSGPTTGTHE